MRRIIFYLLMTSCVLLTGLSNTEAQDGWTGNINLFLGAKALEEDDWAPADEQGEVGFKLDFRHKDWPLNIAIDFLSAEGDGTAYDPYYGITVDMESETSELNFGLRKIWDHFQYIRPFIGGGISIIHAEAKVKFLGTLVSDSDTGSGLWIGGGVYWTLSKHFNIGFELMASSARVELFGVEVNGGGTHIGILAGYHW
ncbi:MAG: hypothetical protein N2257_05665 [Thermodesulfovibrionales bacterium]|nr:hypothetical protein [Thermodesulfovibrionales bacterium]